MNELLEERRAAAAWHKLYTNCLVVPEDLDLDEPGGLREMCFRGVISFDAEHVPKENMFDMSINEFIDWYRGKIKDE